VRGYFDSSSILQRVHRERIVALSGPRALLMQAAHPLAVSGLLAHTTALDTPYERLARAAEMLRTVAFGSRGEADAITARVRSMHRRVRGRLTADIGPYKAGTPYRADDPELLLWVLFTLYDSGLVVYTRYVGSLDRGERSAYWDDYKVIGRLIGLAEADLPTDLDAINAYRREMIDGDRLFVGDWARREARRIVLDPPVPAPVKPLLATVNFITIALLPDPIRRQYRFSPIPPDPIRKLLVASGAEYAKRVLMPFVPARVRLAPGSGRAAGPSRSAAARRTAQPDPVGG